MPVPNLPVLEGLRATSASLRVSNLGFMDSLGSSGVFSRFTECFIRALRWGFHVNSNLNGPVPAQLHEHVCRHVACGFMLPVSVSTLESHMPQLTGTDPSCVQAAADMKNRGGTTAWCTAPEWWATRVLAKQHCPLC